MKPDEIKQHLTDEEVVAFEHVSDMLADGFDQSEPLFYATTKAAYKALTDLAASRELSERRRALMVEHPPDVITMENWEKWQQAIKGE